MKRMEIESIDEIAEREAPQTYPDFEFFGQTRLEAWIEGFKTGYLYRKAKQERWKPVDVVKGGLCVYKAKSLTEAATYSGVSNSHICHLMQTGQKTKTGYKFKPGKCYEKGKSEMQ